MRYCEFCAANISDDAKFCPACGNKVQEVKMNVDPYYDPRVDDQDSQQYVPPQSSGSIQEPTNTVPQQHYDPYNTSVPPQYEEPLPPNKGLTWLIISIISTCCCTPLNIITIVFAILSMTSHKNRDYEAANNYARIAMILFFVFLAISIIMSIVLGVTGVLSDIMYNMP